MFNRNGVSQSRLEFLRSLSLFEGVPDKVLARVDPLLTQVSVQPGRVLTEQGGGSSEAFIVAEGTAEVRVDGEVVRETQVGELIGELGVIDHRPRSATVTALTPMTLLVLNPRELSTLAGEESLGQQIRRNVELHQRGPQA